MSSPRFRIARLGIWLFVGVIAFWVFNLKPAKLFRSRQESAEIVQLRENLHAFREEASKLSDEAAAARWLELFDHWVPVSQEIDYSSDYATRLTFRKMIEVLPPSRSWKALTDAIDRRAADKPSLQHDCLQILSSVLQNDEAGRQRAITAFRKRAGENFKLRRDAEDVNRSLNKMEYIFILRTGDGKDQFNAFLALLEGYEKEAVPNHEDFWIPDLLQEADEQAVTPLLKRALALKCEIHIQGEKTRRLAAQLALTGLEHLKRPCWSLIQSGEDAALYEGIVKKFPQDTSTVRREADQVYLAYLVVSNRMEDATRFILALAAQENGNLSHGISEMAALQQQGFGRQVRALMRQLLEHEPALPLWRTYIELSAHEGESQDALQMLHTALAKPGLKAGARAEVESQLYKALLAAGQSDEGLMVLRESLKTQTGKAPEPAVSAGGKPGERLTAIPGVSSEAVRKLQSVLNRAPDSEPAKLIENLILLGLLLKKPEVVEEGFQAAMAEFSRLSRLDNYSQSLFEIIVEQLVRANRLPEASAFAEKAIEQSAAFKEGSDEGARMLTVLMWVYSQEKRFPDMVKLLATSPHWGSRDLADLSRVSFSDPLLLLAAKALAETGQKEESKRLLERVVTHFPGKDSVYALMIELGGDDLEARLDALQRRDRFEERPLIWKARLQLDQNRIEDAEKTVRAAIAIDPSDGEQGKGDRMRAYAVLAEILDKKGDPAQAKIMRGAVEAIRLSENADDWWQAGLLSEAVAMYEKALTHFADAYCIQSRLALRYSEVGDFAKAEMHYQRAFELMPDSFGRVESHCFGCEGAFNGKRAQNIADRIFTQLEEKMPDKPQVFYLLGYLRDQQQRPHEAADHYRRAVKLDPDYLNAWKKLLATADSVSMPRAEREEAVLALFRLRPTSAWNVGSVANLRLLWDRILDAEARMPRMETGPLYSLPASKDPTGSSAAILRARRLIDHRDLRESLSRHPLIDAIDQTWDIVDDAMR